MSAGDYRLAVPALNTNYSTGPPIYGNFLLDGPSDGSNAFNFIQFTYDYSNAPAKSGQNPNQAPGQQTQNPN
jgi:hypothetical protein